jgi:hypothetical protein
MSIAKRAIWGSCGLAIVRNGRPGGRPRERQSARPEP